MHVISHPRWSDWDAWMCTMMILMPLVDWDVACMYIYIMYNDTPPVPQIEIRRPLCLAWGGGVREEQSSVLDSTAAVASPCMFLSIHGIHPIHVSTPRTPRFTFFVHLLGLFTSLSWNGFIGSCFLSTYWGPLPFLLTVSKVPLRPRVDGLRRHRLRLTALGCRWCLAFSDPLPTSFIFVSVARCFWSTWGPYILLF